MKKLIILAFALVLVLAAGQAFAATTSTASGTTFGGVLPFETVTTAGQPIAVTVNGQYANSNASTTVTGPTGPLEGGVSGAMTSSTSSSTQAQGGGTASKYAGSGQFQTTTLSTTTGAFSAAK